MGDRLTAELDRLAGMDLTALSARWRRAFGRAVPPGLSRALLQRVLAYRLQADELGDVDREVGRALGRLAARQDEVIPLPDRRATKPGTLLLREWQGETQRVTVLDRGYAWDGRTYDSLSKVAHAITGTKWNGPRFFGLRSKAPRDAGSRVGARTQ